MAAISGNSVCVSVCVLFVCDVNYVAKLFSCLCCCVTPTDVFLGLFGSFCVRVCVLGHVSLLRQVYMTRFSYRRTFSRLKTYVGIWDLMLTLMYIRVQNMLPLYCS